MENRKIINMYATANPPWVKIKHECMEGCVRKHKHKHKLKHKYKPTN